MRILPAAALLLPLAGCGEGSAFDEAFRNSYREKGVQSCATEARATMARSGPSLVPAAEIDRMCACAVDRLMQGKSARELMSAPDDAAQQAAIEQCVAPGAAGQGAKPGA